jgi:hypothetical protein
MSVLATGDLAAEAAPTVLDDRRRSTSNHRSDDGTFSRNARVSSPAPRLSTVRAPFAMARSTASSISRVRTISAQPSDSPNGSDRRIAVPRSPAMRRACGSWKRASGRSDSIARYIATQRAVSETSRIEPGVAEVRRLALRAPARSSRAEVHVRQRVRHVSMFSYSQALSLRLTVGVLQERSMPSHSSDPSESRVGPPLRLPRHAGPTGDRFDLGDDDGRQPSSTKPATSSPRTPRRSTRRRR